MISQSDNIHLSQFPCPERQNPSDLPEKRAIFIRPPPGQSQQGIRRILLSSVATPVPQRPFFPSLTSTPPHGPHLFLLSRLPLVLHPHAWQRESSPCMVLVSCACPLPLGECWSEGKDATLRSRPSLQPLVRRRQSGQGHPSQDSAL
jgi:hypothetical protein